jgi:hypothetical protein
VTGITAIVFTMVVQSHWTRAAVLILGALALLATGSRTSTAAYVCAVSWLCLTRSLGRGFQAALGIVTVGAFVWASSTIAEDVGNLVGRSGSDALRSRIDAASAAKTAVAPWHGYGLGQGTVTVDGLTWFFNSSYQDLIVEGGVILAVVVFGCFALAGFGLRARAQVTGITTWESRAAAAATLFVFFCASRLGEVFFSASGMFVLGIGLARLAALSPQTESQGTPVGTAARIGDT